MPPSVLPYELVRAIFELAASDGPRTTFTLLLVSHAAQNWLERGLYAKVHIRNEADRGAFERCRIARRDDAFLASAVQQLCTAPNTELLSVCTNITHLTLYELDRQKDYEQYFIDSLRHLRNVKYLVLEELEATIFSEHMPPHVTHLQLHDTVWPNKSLLQQFTQGCPFLSHIMLDCPDYRNETLADSLPLIMHILQGCQHIALIVLPDVSDSENVLAKIRSFQERYPQLVLFGNGIGDAFQNVMQCDKSLVLQFEFWDEMEEFLAKRRT